MIEFRIKLERFDEEFIWFAKDENEAKNQLENGYGEKIIYIKEWAKWGETQVNKNDALPINYKNQKSDGNETLNDIPN